MIPVGAGSPAIVAKNRQSQKPAPTMYDARSIGHDISCYAARLYNIKLKHSPPDRTCGDA
ncbi:hypothetical protein QUB61_31855 [Microcoleus sp. C2D2]